MYKTLLGIGMLGLGAGLMAADKSAYSLMRPVPVELMRDLSTDRPDQTESPYTVDAGHFQLEMDLVTYTRDHDTSSGADVELSEWNVAPMNLKLGLTNHVDIQLMFDPQIATRETDRATGAVTKAAGVGDLTTRVKINFWGNDGGSTAFAIMPFVKWPLAASDIRNGKTEGGVIFIFGAELPAGWGTAVMTEVDWVSDGTGGRDREWINTITFAHDLTTRLGGYFEFVAVTGDAPGFKWQGQFDAGLTYAIDANTQLDLGCNFGVTRSAPDYQPFVGLSRRF